MQVFSCSRDARVSIKIPVTDLVLHGRDGAVRHPVHCVGQWSDRGQSTARQGRAARLLHLRCRHMLGRAAFVTQVLKNADDTATQKGVSRGSVLSVRDQCCPFGVSLSLSSAKHNKVPNAKKSSCAGRMGGGVPTEGWGGQTRGWASRHLQRQSQKTTGGRT